MPSLPTSLSADTLRRLLEQIRTGRTTIQMPTPPASRLATTVRVGHPLSEAELLVPARPEYCPDCGIDLQTNPGACVTAVVPDSTAMEGRIQVRCDCARRPEVVLPVWLYR